MNAPLTLPSLSADDAEYLGLIAARLGRGRFALGGADWYFELAPAAAPLPLPASAFAMDIEWGGALLRLVAPASLPGLLYAHQFPDAALDLMPEELALAGFELAWREVLGQLEKFSGRKVRLLSGARCEPPSPAPGLLAFVLSLDSQAAGDGLHAVLFADAPALALLALLARRMPAPARPRLTPSLPLSMRLELADMWLPSSTLRRLCVHDVLLPDSVIDATEPRLRLRPDERHAVRVRLATDTLIVESVLEKTLMTVPAAPPTSAPATPASSGASIRLDDLEVRVAFDLGDKNMTLGELAALQPGQVLALDAPLPRLVAIRANGQLIGHGELVKVDDRVGVRVLELRPAGETE